MSNLINETIYKRCDEILLNDEMYRRSNDKIVSLEKKIKESFTPEQLNIYNQIEYETMEASANREALLYRQGFNDGLSVLNAKQVLSGCKHKNSGNQFLETRYFTGRSGGIRTHGLLVPNQVISAKVTFIKYLETVIILSLEPVLPSLPIALYKDLFSIIKQVLSGC